MVLRLLGIRAVIRSGSMKNKLKEVNFIRNNYRRLRKIFLHIVHGRFYSALKLANHYNPVYRLTVRNPLYLKRRQRKSLVETLQRIYSYPYEGSGEKFKVKLIFRDGDFLPSSSAFIRLISPLLDGSLKDEVEIRIESAQNLSDYDGEDFLIVQRTAFDNLKQVEKILRQTNHAKIIVDNDDAFHAIDESHPEYFIQSRRNEAVRFLMDKADQIWVSTPTLVEKELAGKTRVVENTLDSRIWQQSEISKASEGPVQMVYMGTATHDADLGMIVPALDKLNAEYPGSFELTVIGVSQDLPEKDWVMRLTTPYLGSLYPSFVRWFLSQGPFDIGLSPLVDSGFNKAKSDIKCLDYLAAGILPVVSDVLPYQSKEIEDFIIKVKNDEKAWAKALSEIVSSPQKFREQKQKIIPKAQDYIWQKRSSGITAQILLKNLQDLTK